jgi:hypothetical protein
MTLRAAVFSFKVYVTSLFGFLTRLPKVDLAHVSPYDVLQRVETGEVYLYIYFSNVGAAIDLVNPPLNTVLKFLLLILTLQKPNARSIFLSYLIKSLMAKKIVFKASVTTSVPSIAAAATGTGFA